MNLQEIEQLGPQALITAINDLILHDFDQLIYILYRLDIPEAKLKTVLAEHPQEDAAKIIDALIIERQIQKQKSRQQYNQNGAIPDADKW
ncbi:hypothetical protein [Francisella tularensis]|uniref:hypothetical protein n=1 Tax=Francisella tularensis TaxID=263 RepID=UPI001C0E98AE|nr:hypothetical protein [Francisella tularensis]MBK2247172.1 hypothetical protein [Francisella tularensis]